MAPVHPGILVFGNVTLDIICKTVDDVPRYDSISFQESAVTPGGCASNVALGLAQQGERAFLMAVSGNDQAAAFQREVWDSQGVDLRYLRQIEEIGTGISIGLVDRQLQPRFIHTSGANATLDGSELKPDIFKNQLIEYLHIAGYFVLPGVLQPEFTDYLAQVKDSGVFISLDVVRSPAMLSPEHLWSLFPHLDLFTCNLAEAEILVGEKEPSAAAEAMRRKGIPAVVIKLGADGCWLAAEGTDLHLPGIKIENVVDTTGAGDAFASGMLAAMRRGAGLEESCLAGIRRGAEAVQYLGAVKLDEV
jgi:sugar/nucleoside kinase (ribokinase family)